MKKIVGVASCPAGIAHTYMAAESVIIEGKSRGYEVKMETNGAGGVENRLTDEEISEAVCIVIAADTNVEMERFRGKPLIEVSVGEAIRKAKKLFDKIEEGDLEIY
jgi:fructose-specific phosphotransferase system IIB component